MERERHSSKREEMERDIIEKKRNGERDIVKKSKKEKLIKREGKSKKE